MEIRGVSRRSDCPAAEAFSRSLVGSTSAGGKFPVRRSSSLIIEKYQAIHIYCAASGATYEYALDIFAALFVRVTASL